MNLDNKHTFQIYNVYLTYHKKNSVEEIEQIYSILEEEAKTNYQNEFFAGDFNSKIVDSHNNYPENVGYFGKDKTNPNGKKLIDFLSQNNFHACNTFFNHKLAHVTTFTSNLTNPTRRNPYRSHIDFIL